ncbi:hypothetical protein [Alicyclobacillus sp. ALC3]|uniref:hypothetical protein n=1 Tax=Alicyclobacillus sp. ALC3 TaxID=2796143 RepID=UPI0023798032|nr:hypothetical protein [Alicyclobacillus sp. ALC3]WDL98089.1 hypothetical protein JC200_05140 [Alicyclobacillus sp. ALC3]
MSVWVTVLKKDIWILKNQWFGFLGVAVIATAGVLTGSSLGILHAWAPLTVGVILMFTPLVALPAQMARGINKEIKGTAPLWLHTPTSGWAMLGSKLISSLIGALMYFVVCYSLALALFHSVNIAHALPPLHNQSQTHGSGNGVTLNTQNGITLVNLSPRHISILVAQLPRIEFYVMLLLLCYGLYVSVWVTLIYMSVYAVRNQLKKFSWIVGFGVVLGAIWGLGALKNTTLYKQLFGWGSFPVLNLFPSDVRALFPGHTSAAIVSGYFVFNAILVVLLFFIAGLLIERYMEV